MNDIGKPFKKIEFKLNSSPQRNLSNILIWIRGIFENYIARD